MASNGELNADTVAGVTAICENVSYYLNLRLSAKSQNVEVTVPAAVHQIVELASALPRPDVYGWAALAVGKMPKDVKTKTARPEGESGDAKPRTRGKWTEANKEELKRIVDDEAFRTETLGADGTHNGNVNWAALARRYGFSGPAPIHRQYKAMTGRDPPGVKPKPTKEGEEGAAAAAAAGEPPAKKPKTEAPAAVAPRPPAAPAASDGWSADACSTLIKLVDDESFRKAKTGKRHMKWSRVADCLGKNKKECKKKYTALTGKDAEEH